MWTTFGVILIGVILTIGILALMMRAVDYLDRRVNEAAQREAALQKDVAFASPEVVREDMIRHDALLRRVEELFYSIDPRGESKTYEPISSEQAETSARAYFNAIDAIIEEGYATKVFDPLHVRLVLKTQADIQQCALLLHHGLRAQVVEFLVHRLRICGVSRDFYEEARDTYTHVEDDQLLEAERA